MKKNLVFVMIMSLAVCLCGCIIGSQSGELFPTKAETEKETVLYQPSQDEVIFTIPPDFSFDIMYLSINTTFSMAAFISENAKNIEYDKDGSRTVSMSREDHEALLENLKQATDADIRKLVFGSEKFEISDIRFNDEYTVVDVYLGSDDLDFVEQSICDVLYGYVHMMAICSGNSERTIASVNYYNSDGVLVMTKSSVKRY